MTTRAPHVMILASAGSGKTYALTNRFVELLVRGAAPDRIVALTFTRKAAGEFFDEILRKLARAATDERFAARLAADLGAPHLAPRDFRRHLRAMVDAMHRLRLGTLDSFFARIAQAFPLELGLDGGFEILQEHAAELQRRRVLRSIFGRAGRPLESAQSDFIEAFKRATFGLEEKQLGARLDGFLDRYHENFLAAPSAERWGDAARIWPDGAEWFAETIKIEEAVRDLRGSLGELTDGQRARWEAFFSAVAEWRAGVALAPPLEYVLRNAFAVWGDLCGGAAEIVIDRRKLALPAGACRALRRVLTHMIAAELVRKMETTRGIFQVLRGYEAVYHDQVRRTGRLSFADVQRLLQPVALTRVPRSRGGADEAADGEPADDAQLALDFDPRATTAGDDARLFIDYRLDAEIDHWLLDEFQDTSFGQWAVLRNLIDEVVQDPEQRRTFFCVGDVKQAIYAWREGDPRLFREIFNHYNDAAAGTVEERHLNASWRSGPAVVEMVNAVFGAAGALAELFPGAASAAWNREWRAHESAVPEREGQAALIEAADEPERWRIVAQLIEEIRPAARGLTCAVLVQTNKVAATLADALRQAGIAALAEADLHVANDNPLGAALLALAQAAAHPGDTVAAMHVAMSPLAAALRGEGIDDPDACTRRVLGQIHAEGFERTFEFWIKRVEPALAADDEFSRVRAQQFVAAAGLFDALGSRDVDEFIAFMERHVVRAPESAGVVRVMTVHKSKGLGFDVVIVPDLEGNRIDEWRGGLAVRKAEDRSVDWILDLPSRLFFAQDPVLSAYVADAEADACYENLSLLYVALTRAKRAMYVVVEPVGKSKSRNFPRLLTDTLGGEPAEIRVGAARFTSRWSAGRPDWHLRLPAPNAGAEAFAFALEPLASPPTPPSIRRAARRASASATVRLASTAWFALERAAASEFGTELHELLARVEWSEGDVDALLSEAAEGQKPATVAAARACLTAPGLQDVWRRPAAAAVELWRERAFEVVLDDVWVSGVFDRVIVERAADGRALGVTVFDFKTDRIAREADVDAVRQRHAPQLNVYRRVAARLTGLPASAVCGRLVLTQLGRTVEIS